MSKEKKKKGWHLPYPPLCESRKKKTKIEVWETVHPNPFFCRSLQTATGLRAFKYWRCSILVTGVGSTKSNPVFIHKKRLLLHSLQPPTPHPFCLSLHLLQHPFSAAAVTRATSDSKSCCWATTCSILPILRVSEWVRERERQKETFQSVNKALLGLGN